MSGNVVRSATRKPKWKKKSGMRVKRQTRGDALVLGFVEQEAEELAAGALALGFGLDDDGADLREVAGRIGAGRRSRGKGHPFLPETGDSAIAEVADVLANFSVVAAKQGAVTGERVDEVEDLLARPGRLGLADGGSAEGAGARGGAGGGVAESFDERDGGGMKSMLVMMLVIPGYSPSWYLNDAKILQRIDSYGLDLRYLLDPA